MAQDYKRSRKSKKNQAEASPWKWLAAGFGLGIVAALGLYLHLTPDTVKAPDHPVPNASAPPKSSVDSENAAAAVTAPVKPAESSPDSATRSTASTSPKPAAGSAAGQNEYDFYNMLPDFEVVVADDQQQPVAAKPTTSRPVRRAETPGKPDTYILQAGSFRKFIDADRRKAELAFKGIESNISQVVLKEEEVWFRVYVGPSNDFASFENMRSTLRRANIDVLILKVRQ